MKNSIKNIIIILISILTIMFSINSFVYAESEIQGHIAEITEQYKKWMELPEETRQNTIAPKKYNIKQKVNKTRLFKSNYLSKYNLQDIIPENVVIRDQMKTNTCWAFSSIGALESTLGLKDYKNGNTLNRYDFSERHLEYATSKTFLNDEINPIGYNRNINTGGNVNMAITYFTNGSGPIKEDELPFQNNANLIELAEIQNKHVTAKIVDTTDFPSIYDESFTQKEEVDDKIKNHIMNYGGVTASIYGAQKYSEYYNNSTGAIYCEKCMPNHSVLIIGWDDTYAVENFNSNHRPQNQGAWIIKNSWGSNIGKNGIMYLSYEDANVYYYLNGIQNASNNIDYDNLYQYNKLGYSCVGYVDVPKFAGSKLYLANDFVKKTNKKEYLNEISIYAPQNYICSVYVNGNDTSKYIKDLTKVKLKAGETESFEAGYHTIEFDEPIEITGNEFTVVVEIENGFDNEIYYCLESNENCDSLYETVKTENAKCYLSISGQFEKGAWNDLSNKKFLGVSADSTIKAFTINEKEENPLKKGDITGDGKVTAKDLNALYAHISGTKLLSDEEVKRADLTGDNKITAKDLNALYAHIAGTKPFED